MDIIAHTLWSGIAARAINVKARAAEKRKLVKTGWMAFWGAFPDLFAFTPVFTVLIVGTLSGIIPAGRWPGPHAAADPSLAWAMNLTSALYGMSHSLVAFSAVYIVVCLIRRGIQIELLGWLLHILIDIPTHTAEFYPTPFLWPLSSFKVSGIAWPSPWFMAINYLAITLSFYLLRRKSSRTTAPR